MDFYFTEKQNALRFTDFLSSHVPTRSKYSRKLLSADHKSNEGKFKHNFIVEIVPLCKVRYYVQLFMLSLSISSVSMHLSVYLSRSLRICNSLPNSYWLG